MNGNFFQKLFRSTLPFLFVFIASLYNPIDPDLGWHLRYGQYFFENGKPLYENTFSTQMPEYRWPNISWGTDTVTFAFYNLGGFLGLTIGGALIVSVTFLFFSKAYRLDYWEKAVTFPIILYLLHPINSSSFRGQLISLFFLGVLVYLTSRYNESGGRILYFVPLLFLIWANLHGLFLLGFGILLLWQGLYIVTKFLEKKQIKDLTPHIKLFTLVNVPSFLATLIHPFGIGIYQDALAHFNDPLLKGILEYLPPEEFSIQWFNLFLTSVLAISGITLIFFNKKLKQKIPELGTIGILYPLSIWVKRYSWAMYYFLIPFIKPLAEFIKPDSKKGVFLGATLLFAVSTGVVTYFKYPYGQFVYYNWEKYCQKSTSCSKEAAENLRKYYIEGKTMTLYNWGGWLIWNFPDLKPSIDGRMHLWRDEEGFSAFEYDYYLEQNVTDINDSIYDIVFTSKLKPIYKRLQKLEEQDRWKLVYEDESTVIFSRQRR